VNRIILLKNTEKAAKEVKLERKIEQEKLLLLEVNSIIYMKENMVGILQLLYGDSQLK
jgi:hypothetical protein